MGFFFKKRIKLCKGVNLNLSKSGVGISYGIKGLRVSHNSKGTYLNAGAKGFYYRKKIDTKDKDNISHNDFDKEQITSDDIKLSLFMALSVILTVFLYVVIALLMRESTTSIIIGIIISFLAGLFIPMILMCF